MSELQNISKAEHGHTEGLVSDDGYYRYIINTPNQITAAALVIQVWLPRDKVNPGVWIAIFLVAILAINYFGIGFFGELEFWFSSIKVLVILGIIVLSVILAAGGGPNHHATGFYYWSHPGGELRVL